MSEERGAKQLRSANAVRAYQREWFQKTKEKVVQGEPFVLCHGDECEEICNVMDIPVMVVNYWNAIIAVKGMTEYYNNILVQRGYETSFPYPRSAMVLASGLASTMDNKPQIAPWGGLPKPTVIVGSTRGDLDLRVLEIWAREYGCLYFPLEFSFSNASERPAPPRWWERMRDHWDELIDPHRLDLRVKEEKALIRFLEVITGRAFSLARLNEALELVNEQADYWRKVRDLVAKTVPCPVGLRDQLAMYQANWHRGTPVGRDLVKAYYEEVRERVEQSVAAYPNEKLRLMWLEGTPPAWAQYAEEKYGAVCVCGLYSSVPADSYARSILNNDPIRAMASRHMILDPQTPDFYLRNAELYQCDGVVQVARPSGPSRIKPFFEEAGMPLVEIPGDRDDAEVREILDNFIRTRLLSKHKFDKN